MYILAMKRFFNTTGPCRPDKHYMLPPSARLVGANLKRYINDELYWVLHAPRQTGKTTFLKNWMLEINSSGEAIACYVSVERCQAMPAIREAMPALAEAIREYADGLNLPVPAMPASTPESLLSQILAGWSGMVAPKPLVVLFDEVDVLEGPALISFLRQLRGGFAMRDIGKFPVSVALVGLRDLRDYLIHSKDGVPLNPGSPFNIKHDSATLANFSQADIATLTSQHTDDTGQIFSAEALDRIWALTSGQPWLVNALCDKLVSLVVPAESKKTVGAEHIDHARELLIQSRATHLDALGQRLRDPRVKKVVQPILIGDSDPTMAEGDDFRYCEDLGLVTRIRGTPGIANAIYREILARELSFGMQMAIPEPEFRWTTAHGHLDMDALLREFQKFWAWNSEIWEQKADYTEAFPHLLLMAFLQRVVNGGGTIEREFAAGSGRIDLAVFFSGGVHVIEIKLIHPRMGRDATMRQGLEQIARYADTVGATTRHLILFDRRPEWKAKPWDDRLGWESKTAPDGNPVTVVWA